MDSGDNLMTKSRDLANAATALNAVTATEIGYVDGVTSAIQTQLNAKQAVVSGVNDTEIGYLDGVTSAIQTQLDAKTAKSTLSTTGDIYYASAANTPARLGIGSTDQVLKVSGGVPAWATPASGGMTLLSTTSLSGSTTTISSISGSYTDLVIYITDYDVSVDGPTSAYLRLNGATGNDYSQAATVAGTTTPSLTDKFTLCGSIHPTSLNGLFWIQIPLYSNTDTFKICQMYSIAQDNTVAPRLAMHNNFGAFNETNAISSITIYPSTGTATGTAYIYGVK